MWRNKGGLKHVNSPVNACVSHPRSPCAFYRVHGGVVRYMSKLSFLMSLLIRYMPLSSKSGAGHAVTARGCCGVCVCIYGRRVSFVCVLRWVRFVSCVPFSFFLHVYIYMFSICILKGGFIYMSGNV
jgi:hypothetical protein